ncbi:MAG: pseudouridine synthase [Eubacteriales bacterium]
MQILYRDRALLVCVKPAGTPSQADPSGSPDMLALLGATLEAEGEDARLWPVHRLDRPVGGVMAFARTAPAAAALSASAASHAGFLKDYLLVTAGAVPEVGEMRDYLRQDTRLRRSVVSPPGQRGAQAASLAYRCAERVGHEDRVLSLVAVRLHTGRFHQIRAQFAARGLPILGDGKYGGASCPQGMALWAHRLSFAHPLTGEGLSFAQAPPAVFPWTLFSAGAVSVEFAKKLDNDC